MDQDGRIRLVAVLRATGRTVSTNGRLRRVAATWGLWVTGEWALLVLLSVTAYDRGGAAAVGIVGVLRVVPAALAAPLGAMVADRRPRAQVLTAVQVTWSVLVASVPVMLMSDSLLPTYVVVGVASAVSTAFRPAINAIVPQVVDRPEELLAANSIYSLVEAAGSLIGPLLASLLLLRFSTRPGYFGVAMILGVSAAISAGVRTEFQPPTEWPAGSWWQRLSRPLAGFPALVGNPVMRTVYAAFLAQTFTRGLLNVFMVVAASSVLSSQGVGTGVLFAALGAGGLVGALLTLAGGSWRPALPFSVGMSLWGIPLVVIAIHPTAAVTWFGLATVGAGNAVATVYGYTLFARFVPDHLLGRAFGAFWSSAWGSTAVGSFVAGPLVARFGLPPALALVGVVMIVVSLLCWPCLRTADRDLAVDEGDVCVLRRSPLLAPLTRVALEQLARHAFSLKVPTGTTVIAQGEGSDTFYVVDEGELSARVNGQEVRRLAGGDCFGEIAALERSTRTATVVALRPTRLLALDGTRFVLAVTGHAGAGHAAASLVHHRTGTAVHETTAPRSPKL